MSLARLTVSQEIEVPHRQISFFFVLFLKTSFSNPWILNHFSLYLAALALKTYVTTHWTAREDETFQGPEPTPEVIALRFGFRLRISANESCLVQKTGPWNHRSWSRWSWVQNSCCYRLCRFENRTRWLSRRLAQLVWCVVELFEIEQCGRRTWCYACAAWNGSKGYQHPTASSSWSCADSWAFYHLDFG